MPSWDTSLCHQVGVALQLDAHLPKGSFVYLRVVGDLWHLPLARFVFHPVRRLLLRSVTYGRTTIHNCLNMRGLMLFPERFPGYPTYSRDKCTY
jgi:hypothetical protein